MINAEVQKGFDDFSSEDAELDLQNLNIININVNASFGQLNP